MFNFFKKLMNKSFDVQKEQYRGTIKQIMRVNRLRSISIANYNKWKQQFDGSGFHSVKFDMQDGYINLYEYGKNGRCGKIVADISTDEYKNVHDTILNIINDSKQIPNNVRRNILVKISR